VRRFGLFLDDIPGELQHAADRAAYPDLAAAHVALIGAVFAALRPEERLIVCPLVYCGTGTEPYLHALADIDPRIDIFWTGRAICSPTLDLADATVLARTIRRPPTYWDNYPVNDVAMGYELHVGPYRGRDPLLWRAATGIVANGMELFESSRIPFLTIADYLADPMGYHPESSRQRAIEAVAGPADADAYAIFADNVRSSCLGGPDAPVVGAAIEAARFELADGRPDDAARRLAALASRLLGAADHLLRGPVANPGLIEEARPWLEAFALGARAIGRISALAGDGRIGPEGATDPDAAAELRQALFMLRRARVRVFGDVLEMTLAELSGTMIRPGVVPELEGGNR
jgi:hyaluronoglucosaminidase